MCGQYLRGNLANGAWILFLSMTCRAVGDAADPPPASQLPDSSLLSWPETEGALADRLMNGAHTFVERKIAESGQRRALLWNYDVSSAEAYEQSVAPLRQHLKLILGVVDAERVPHVSFERFSAYQDPAYVAETEQSTVYQVRWPVLKNVTSEGLLVVPKRNSPQFLIVLPDADQTPEEAVGLAAGSSLLPSRVRQAVDAGQTVLVPTLIDRRIYLDPPGNDPRLRESAQSHREWIYRQAFHMGRHIIGYEVQKVIAAVDGIKQQDPAATVGVEGVGEGALLAFYAAACEPRIDAVVLHGYFGPRERVWAEPIYRNLFGLLREFGDAEIASLIHPRHLTIAPIASPSMAKERTHAPSKDAPVARTESSETATPVPVANQKGDIVPFDAAAAAAEIARIIPFARQSVQLLDAPLAIVEGQYAAVPDGRRGFDPIQRHDRLFRELETHVQSLVERSDAVRDELYLYRADPRLRPGNWSTTRSHPTLDPRAFVEASHAYRLRFAQEAMGRFDEPLLPLNPRTRKISETNAWTAYDVVLDVYPELFAWGVLVLPKDIQPGERRPVVVCQHGRGGLPRNTIDRHESAYSDLAAKLAERGFITFAPHNLYRGEERYRWLNRKANSIGCTLFSFIIASHQQTLEWLKAQPWVDPQRIAFYGLSYGGETAMRVPSLLPDYCLSICSGDFNQWTRKVASTDFPNGFMRSIEWEMPYWNLGQTFDYAEMAYLIFPRPFMVERGHHDRVSVDQWVAHEYAKVRWLYAQYGLADRTEIEFFQGGHSINGQGTFAFLHRHLDWPVRP
jgi:cephalosporin-C deacetylase-like acetyl esterase